jgi:Fe2+ transport system protein FeoA
MIADRLNPSDLRDLSEVASGDCATVERITAEEATAKRLADMGFVRGAAVTKVRSGRPCLVRIGTTCVGLGLPLQKTILVAVVDLVSD